MLEGRCQRSMLIVIVTFPFQPRRFISAIISLSENCVMSFFTETSTFGFGFGLGFGVSADFGARFDSGLGLNPSASSGIHQKKPPAMRFFAMARSMLQAPVPLSASQRDGHTFTSASVSGSICATGIGCLPLVFFCSFLSYSIFSLSFSFYRVSS